MSGYTQRLGGRGRRGLVYPPLAGAPVVSIGGAGTFDGVFITGIIAVLLASLL